jgi:D-alanine-D-alanine ligase
MYLPAMRIAIIFDTPHPGWGPEDHARQMEKEVKAWQHDEPEMEYQIADALLTRGHEVCLVGIHHEIREPLSVLAAWQPELVVNGVEGFRGEADLDYLPPALLEAEGYRYTGAPPMALLVTRNKAMSKKILAYHGINVPGFATYRLGEEVESAPDLRFPLIVKPLQTDASAGIARASVVQDLDALTERVAFVHNRFVQPAIVEEFIEGRELYAGVLGNEDHLEFLPLTEMVFDRSKTRPEERIATQSAKWDEPYRERRGIRNVFARPISRRARARIEEICVTAFRTLWLRDYARLDVRLTPEGEVWFIEANANPFISYGHDVANAAQKAGMEYDAFIQRIVDEAVERYERN